MEYCRINECCGIAELDGIRAHNPKEVIRGVAISMIRELEGYEEDKEYMKRNYGHVQGFDYSEAEYQCPHVFFTDIKDCKYGKALASYIKKNKLGTVVSTVSRVNIRSGNQLRMWVWTLNKKALKEWYKKQ